MVIVFTLTPASLGHTYDMHLSLYFFTALALKNRFPFHVTESDRKKQIKGCLQMNII